MHRWDRSKAITIIHLLKWPNAACTCSRTTQAGNSSKGNKKISRRPIHQGIQHHHHSQQTACKHSTPRSSKHRCPLKGHQFDVQRGNGQQPSLLNLYPGNATVCVGGKGGRLCASSALCLCRYDRYEKELNPTIAERPLFEALAHKSQ